MRAAHPHRIDLALRCRRRRIPRRKPRRVPSLRFPAPAPIVMRNRRANPPPPLLLLHHVDRLPPSPVPASSTLPYPASIASAGSRSGTGVTIRRLAPSPRCRLTGPPTTRARALLRLPNHHQLHRPPLPHPLTQALRASLLATCFGLRRHGRRGAPEE
ncbi:hypothetical protein DFH08DRAFT_960244 [Mycena albidolilacea]|uniref:Uncharacterized protein n=1 Tax=Mycena albidolilacea TaxID=1033008 RepID=A0AAD7EQZ4_9AGAR|nr:hypothetical protein DFH08DRAFT_960244 [Mycena albidolilacea]